MVACVACVVYVAYVTFTTGQLSILSWWKRLRDPLLQVILLQRMAGVCGGRTCHLPPSSTFGTRLGRRVPRWEVAPGAATWSLVCSHGEHSFRVGLALDGSAGAVARAPGGVP